MPWRQMAGNISAVRRSYFSCQPRACERTSEHTQSASVSTHTDSPGDDEDGPTLLNSIIQFIIDEYEVMIKYCW